MDTLWILYPGCRVVFVGSLSKLSSESIVKRVEFVGNFYGDLIWLLNGVGAPDLIVVYVPEGCRVETTLPLKYYSMKGSDFGLNMMSISNPRVLVVVQKGGEVGLVEEFVGSDGEKCYWTNVVVEVIISDGASHSYVQTQSLEAVHIKWTSISQVFFGVILLCCYCSEKCAPFYIM